MTRKMGRGMAQKAFTFISIPPGFHRPRRARHASTLLDYFNPNL